MSHEVFEKRTSEYFYFTYKQFAKNTQSNVSFNIQSKIHFARTKINYTVTSLLNLNFEVFLCYLERQQFTLDLPYRIKKTSKKYTSV